MLIALKISGLFDSGTIVKKTGFNRHIKLILVSGIIVLMLLTPFNIFSSNPQKPVRPTRKRVSTENPTSVNRQAAAALPDTISLDGPVKLPAAVVEDEFSVDPKDGDVTFTPVDTIRIVNSPELDEMFNDGVVQSAAPPAEKKVFIPDPTKAVWYSALCPGLGQIYNRRYWKLPIVIGGFMGLGYGASWNNTMLADYTRAYYDLMDNDPSTKSYMDFFPPTTSEESLNRSWLERTLKSRKDYFRRNRDLCIIGMVGVYLIAVVDAYVDASLTNFDITPDLSMQVTPALLHDNFSPYPALGVQWAFNF